ncbi:MAG: GGDEF domain-containing protein [Clostridia bacterium]
MDSEAVKDSINNFQSGFPVIIERKTSNMIYPSVDVPNYARVVGILKNLIETSDKTIYFYEEEGKYFQKQFYAIDDDYVKFEFLDVTNIYKNYVSALETVETLQIDFTTKLPIKSKLFDDLTKYLLYALNSGEEFGIIMYDIDDFKKVNDTLGHEYGDKVLHEFSLIGKNSIRQDIFRSKDIIGRFGGEEFVVLVKGLSNEGMEKVAERIRSNIEKEKSQMPITVSLGCVHSSEIKKDIDLSIFTQKDEKNELKEKVNDIIGLADQALYYSKQHGKNQLTNYGTIKRDLERNEITINYGNDEGMGRK